MRIGYILTVALVDFLRAVMVVAVEFASEIQTVIYAAAYN